jgi:hypothetical protein
MTLALSTALAVLCALGCSSGKRIAKVNDALRLEREELKERVVSLEGENAELHVKIAELIQTSDSELTEDELAAIPRLASIELTRYCSVWTEGGASEARFFVVPKDGRGRFVQVVGEVALIVNSVPETDNANPKLDPASNRTLSHDDIYMLGSKLSTALEVRDSFISGISGTGYMFQVPLTETPTEKIELAISFKDATTGKIHSAVRIVSP